MITRWMRGYHNKVSSGASLRQNNPSLNFNLLPKLHLHSPHITQQLAVPLRLINLVY